MRLPAVSLVLLLLLLTARAWAGGKGGKMGETGFAVFPEPFAGREAAAMQLLYPGWSPETEAVAAAESAAPVHAHLRAARRWITDGGTLLAVLVEITAPACAAGPCPSESTQLAVLGLPGNVLAVVVSPVPVGHHGEGAQTDLGPDTLLMSPEATLLTVTETSRAGVVLRLFAIAGRELRVVFERTVADAIQEAHGSKPACEATVTMDEFGTFPYPLKVKEHCTSTGKTAAEMWRWEGGRYILHGPASDAAVSQHDLSSGLDE